MKTGPVRDPKEKVSNTGQVMICHACGDLELKMQDRKLKSVTGVVISSSGDKSIKVAVDFKVRHPEYGKYVRRRTKFGVHDEHNQAGVGDVVEVVECRPYSKTKSWRLVRVLEKAVQQ